MRSTIPDAQERPVVVRTDYSDDQAWRALTQLLIDDDMGWEFLFVDDPSWSGATVDEVLAAAPEDTEGAVYVADAVAMRAPYPMLAVSTITRDDCEDDEHFAYEMEFGREFRLSPAGLISVSANLSIANMDFPEFAESARDEPDGIYRGPDLS